MAGNLVSNKLLKNNSSYINDFGDTSKLYQYFIRLANQSLQVEKNFYRKAMPNESNESSMSTKLKNINLKELVQIMTNEGTFNEYQETLREAVYGKDTPFLELFYDAAFIKALAGQEVASDSILKNLETDIVDYLTALGETDDASSTTDFAKIEGATFSKENITIHYIINKQASSMQVSGAEILDYFKTKKQITQGEFQKFLAEKVQKESGMSGRIQIKEKKAVLTEILKRINESLQTQGTDLVVKKANRQGYFVSKGRDVRFGNKEGNKTLQEVIFGAKDINNLSWQDVTEKPCVAGDILNGIAFYLENNKSDIEQKIDDTMVEIFNEFKNNWENTNVNFYLVSATGDLAKVKKKDSNSNANARNLEGEFFTLTLGDLEDLNISKALGGISTYEIELRGDKNIFKNFINSDMRRTISSFLKGTPAEVKESTDKIDINIDIIDDTKNLFFNKIEKIGKVSPNMYNNKSISKRKSMNKKEFEEQLFKDAKIVSKGFFDTVEEVIREMKGEELAKSFRNWAMNGGEKNQFIQDLTTLFRKNPASIYEVLSRKSHAHMSGMIGETVFSVMLIRAMRGSSDSVVQILGQTSHGNGEAAVDLKVTGLANIDTSTPILNDTGVDWEALQKKRLTNAGFQIKNYTSSSGSSERLYESTDLSLMDTETMKRYITESFLSKIQDYLTNTKTSAFYTGRIQGESTKDERKLQLKSMANIFSYHLPYFMRYDEAQMIGSEENFGIEQNNFYIINFNFVPTSILFYMLAQSIYIANNEAIKGEGDLSNYFYFSIYKNKNSFSQDFYESYEGIRENQTKANSNMLAWHKNLAINFTGIKVNFKKAFDNLIQESLNKNEVS